MKINVYPRRVRRAKLDLQVGNHPALYLVIAKKIKVFAGFLLQFLHMCGIFTYKSGAKRLTG